MAQLIQIESSQRDGGTGRQTFLEMTGGAERHLAVSGINLLRFIEQHMNVSFYFFSWSETGERYYLKLFRDYVFHQVDHDGRPVLDLGHIIACLNKLDAGIDEKIQLVSRDEQNVFIVTYREVKRGFESAWADISKASNTRR